MPIICGRNLDLRNLEQIPELFLVMVSDLTVRKRDHDNEPAPAKAELSVMVPLGFDCRPCRCVGERGIVEHTVIVELVHCVVLVAQLDGFVTCRAMCVTSQDLHPFNFCNLDCHFLCLFIATIIHPYIDGGP